MDGTKQLAQLKAALKGKWVSGGFCSSHGYGVSADHDSKNCKNKKPGHVDTATRANPAGHGPRSISTKVGMLFCSPPSFFY